MKLVLSVLLMFATPVFANTASKKECSKETLTILFEKSATLAGQGMIAKSNVTSIFVDRNYLKSNLEEVRKKWKEADKDHYERTNKLLTELTDLVKKHPECDPNNIVGTR